MAACHEHLGLTAVIGVCLRVGGWIELIGFCMCAFRVGMDILYHFECLAYRTQCKFFKVGNWFVR